MGFLEISFMSLKVEGWLLGPDKRLSIVFIATAVSWKEERARLYFLL